MIDWNALHDASHERFHELSDICLMFIREIDGNEDNVVHEMAWQFHAKAQKQHDVTDFCHQRFMKANNITINEADTHFP